MGQYSPGSIGHFKSEIITHLYHYYFLPFFFLLECDVLRILRSIMRHCYDFDNNNDDDNDNIDDDEEGVLTKT